MGLSPVLFTFNLILLRPSFRLMVPASPFTATIAPGWRVLSYAEVSGRGNLSLDGMGRNEPYKAFSRSPSSVLIG